MNSCKDSGEDRQWDIWCVILHLPAAYEEGIVSESNICNLWTYVRPSKNRLTQNPVLRNERKDKCLDQCICLFAQSTNCRQWVVFAVIRRPVWSPTRNSVGASAVLLYMRHHPKWGTRPTDAWVRYRAASAARFVAVTIGERQMALLCLLTACGIHNTRCIAEATS